MWLEVLRALPLELEPPKYPANIQNYPKICSLFGKNPPKYPIHICGSGYFGLPLGLGRAIPKVGAILANFGNEIWVVGTWVWRETLAGRRAQDAGDKWHIICHMMPRWEIIQIRFYRRIWPEARGQIHMYLAVF